MTVDPYRFLWREETSADYHMHVYITKGTDLYGYVRNGTSKIQWFSKPFRSWSPSRRSFRKLNKKEIDGILETSKGFHRPFATVNEETRPVNVLDFALAA